MLWQIPMIEPKQVVSFGEGWKGTHFEREYTEKKNTW